MTPQEIVESLRRLCRDIDEGRQPQRIALGRAVGTWAIPVAIGLSSGVAGCGSHEASTPPPEVEPVPVARADGTSETPEPASDGGATKSREAASDGGAAEDAGPGKRADATPIPRPPNDGGTASPRPTTKNLPGDGTLAKVLTGEANEELLKQFSSVAYGAPFRGEPRARVVLRNHGVSGGLDREIVRRYSRRIIGTLRGCYLERLEVRPALKGRVLVRYEINAAGKVASASIKLSSLQDEAMESCVLKTIRKMNFPADDAGEPTTVLARFEVAPPPPAR